MQSSAVANRRERAACLPERSFHCAHVMGDDAHALRVKRLDQGERRGFDHVWRRVIV